MASNGSIWLVPFFGQGHLFPFVELCKQLASRNYKTNLVIPSTLSSSVPPSLSEHPLVEIREITSSLSSVPPSPPQHPSGQFDKPHDEHDPMEQALQDLLSARPDNPNSDRPVCAIVDVMMRGTNYVFERFRVPIISFFTSGACSAAMEYATLKANLLDIKPGDIRLLPGLPEEMAITYLDVKQRPHVPPGGPVGPPIQHGPPRPSIFLEPPPPPHQRPHGPPSGRVDPPIPHSLPGPSISSGPPPGPSPPHQRPNSPPGGLVGPPIPHGPPGPSISSGPPPGPPPPHQRPHCPPGGPVGPHIPHDPPGPSISSGPSPPPHQKPHGPPDGLVGPPILHGPPGPSISSVPPPGGPPPPGGQPPWVDEAKGSMALMINTCDDLEHPFIEYITNEIGKPVWGVGPLLPDQYWKSTSSLVHDHKIRPNRRSNITEDDVIQWLNSKPRESVLYVSFGTEVGPTMEEYQELAGALEASNRPFIWATKSDSVQPSLHQRVGQRGLIIRGWAPQLLILSHPSTGGFLSHGGWNSTLEAIVGGVPLLVWPIRGDQFLNAMLVVRYHKVGYMVTDDPSQMIKKDGIINGIERLMGDKDVRKQTKDLQGRFENGYPASSSAALHGLRDLIIEN